MAHGTRWLWIVVRACVSAPAAAALVAGPGGCELPGGNPNSPFARAPRLPAAPTTAPAANPPLMQAPVVRLRLITVEVPVGTASDSEELWSYLNEEPGTLSRSVDLSANGLRVGLAPRRAWDDVARLVRGMTGTKNTERKLLTLPGEAHSITLKKARPAQTIFTFHEDQTLSGADYPPGDNLLTVLCMLDEDDSERIIVTAQPQIRSTRLRSEAVRQSGKPAVVSKPVLFPFRALTFRMPVRSGDLIVVGPSPAAMRADSVGHHFLITAKEGIEFETLLILIPAVQRRAPTPVPVGPEPGRPAGQR